MPKKQEDYARELYGELQERFGTGFILLRQLLGKASVTLKGEGMIWRCTVKRGKRLCKIDLRRTEEILEYLTSFEQDGKVLANGCSLIKGKVITAVEDWLNHYSVEQLSDTHDFIDGRKKDLMAIWNTLLVEYPGV